MKSAVLAAAAALSLAACAGDQHTTQQSPGQPSRSANSTEVDQTAGSNTRFMRNRIYQITRLETADQPRGEWRAFGETIQQNGSTIEFVEMGSGRTVSFTAPHQVTATSSRSDRLTTPPMSDNPAQDRISAPSGM